MKPSLKTFLLATILFVALPLVGVNFLPSDWGFPFLLLTLYMLNPMFFIYAGTVTGKNIKNNWFIPLFSFLIFGVSNRLIYGTVQLIIINVIVCGISILITHLIEKRKKVH